MKIFSEEFVDSKIKPRPNTITNVFLYIPSIENSGSSTMATKQIQAGIKQMIKREEIINTILEIFWSRFEMTLLFSEDVAVLLHALFLWNLMTKVTVQIRTMAKDVKGIKTLLMANETFSTLSRSSVYTKLRMDRFLLEEYAMDSLLTQYTGVALPIRTMKTQKIMIQTLLGVTMVLT